MDFVFVFVTFASALVGLAQASEPALEGCRSDPMDSQGFRLLCPDLALIGVLVEATEGTGARLDLRRAGLLGPDGQEMKAGKPASLPMDGVSTSVDTFQGRNPGRGGAEIIGFRWVDPDGAGFVACLIPASPADVARARCGEAIAAARRTQPRTSLASVAASTGVSLGDTDIQVPGCAASTEHLLVCEDGSTLDVNRMDLARGLTTDGALDRVALAWRLEATGWIDQTPFDCLVTGQQGRCLEVTSSTRTHVDAIAEIDGKPTLVRCAGAATPDPVDVPTACRATIGRRP